MNIEKTQWTTVNRYRRFKKENKDCSVISDTTGLYKGKPIMSYGIILFTIVEQKGKKIPLYLISQRRDTVEYVDFIRGQYNINYLPKFFTLMSQSERERMKKYNFKELWDDLWINKNHRIFTDCYEKARLRFEQVKDQILQLLLDSENNIIREPPWGFPKGKKNAKETPINCALREFSEETKLDPAEITIINPKPIVEVYKGSNDKLYGTNYYIAYTKYPLPVKRITTSGIRSSTVSEELGNVEWLNIDEAENKLNHKRTKLLSYVNHIIKSSEWY